MAINVKWVSPTKMVCDGPFKFWIINQTFLFAMNDTVSYNGQKKKLKFVI